MYLRFLLFILILIQLFPSPNSENSSPILPQPAHKNIMLIPLDSRPPCKDFVIDLAKNSQAKVIVPDNKLLDYFTIPGETSLIRQWTLDNCRDVDCIILSIDQLLFGGLIASRELILDDVQIDYLEKFLIDLHSLTNAPIYAFTILPRVQPQQSIDNFQQRRALNAYSRFRGMLHSNINVDDEMLFEVLSQINDDNLNTYLNHFRFAEKLNQRLISLTQNKIIDKLIIGIDDGEKFSIQNELVDNLKSNTENVSIIHGADEIAQTLLAQYLHRDLNVFVKYCNDSTAQTFMPYMPVDVETVVNEKISQLNLNRVNNIDDSDFVLYIFVNDEPDSITQIQSLNHITNLIKHHKVALVDLSVHFDKNETLLPVLIRQGVPINSLIAYAGWNTTSNSIGTALSQSLLARDTLHNLIFLNQRFLEDYFYLKDVIDIVNNTLKANGSYDTSYLDYDTEFILATEVMKNSMSKKISVFKQSSAFTATTAINGFNIKLTDFDVDMNYVWPRTFEIRLHINELLYSK